MTRHRCNGFPCATETCEHHRTELEVALTREVHDLITKRLPAGTRARIGGTPYAVKPQTCERCGQTCKYRRVTCCACGRSVGRWYDCGCAEKWTDSGPARYFCGRGAGTPLDCAHEKAEKERRLDELAPAFLKRMARLNGRWP